MSAILPDSTDRAHRLNSASPSRMAKVHTVSHKKSANAHFRMWVGQCLARAIRLSELTLEQFAGELDRHPSQISKWTRNAEPPQLEPILASSMRPFMLLAMAESTPECEVTTEIRLRRRA